MGKLASKVTKRIMASVLTVAMILPNMTVYASEYSEPAQQTEESVENTETDAAELPSTEDETVQDNTTQDETTKDDAGANEGTGDTTASDETTTDEATSGEDSDSTEKVDGDEEPAQDENEENIPEEDELDAEEVSDSIEAEEPNEAGDEAHTIWLVGDSTVCSFTDNYYYPRYGYGTQIEKYLSADSGYTVNNKALSGRSSLSFLSESNYNDVKTGIKAGDILIVGFGHNDEKAEADRYTNPNGTSTSEGSFAKNLYDNYVKIAQDKGAEVILCTPIARRGTGVDAEGKTQLSDSEKHITSTKDGFEGGDYRQAVVDLGTEVNVPVVDLTKLTTDLYEGMTPDETTYFHARTQSKPSTVDNTHLNIYGAKMVAYMFANEVKTKNYTALAAAIDSDIAAPTKAEDLDKDYPVAGWQDPVYAAPDANPTTKHDPYVIGEGENQVKFIGTAFGSIGGDSKVNTFTMEKDSSGYMHMVGTGNGKLITDKTKADADGFAMYYYRIPKDSMFKISATAVVNSIANEAQSSFGLMARDDMYIDKSADVLSNTNYVAAGTAGNGAYNCFYRNNTVFNSAAGLTKETVKAGGSYDLSIVRNPDGYACTFGSEPTQSGGYDISLLVTDSEYIYVGMFISRTANITFKNIYLEVDGVVLADERKTQYDVTVTNDGNGTAEATPAPAAAGETVTLTATPNEGYVLDHWEVTAASEDAAAVNVVNNKFTMPASDLEVKAIFAESKFDNATVAEGSKDFTPGTAELTGFEGITFANIEDLGNNHGFHSKATGNPIINLHMEEGKKASISLLACCYGAGSKGNNILESSAGVVTSKQIDEESGKGTQFNVLNVESEYVTLTLGNDMFIHNIVVEYAQEETGERKIDVWDFGAKQESNTELYNNRITAVEWLAYKKNIGSDGKFIDGGDYKFGDVTITGVQANDRLYSNEAALAGMSAGANYANQSVGDGYSSSGVYYCNGTGGSGRRLLTIEHVQAGDKIVVYMGNTASGSSDTVHFAGQGAASDQDETFTLTDAKIQKQEFVARYEGTYKIYAQATGSSAKPIYYRVMRLPGVKVSGTINYNGVELPEGYSLLLVNQTTNAETVAEFGVNEDGDPIFTASLAPGYTYKASLAGATGYGFTNDSAVFTVEDGQILTGKNDIALVIEEKDTYDFSGKIKGFASDYAKLGDLKITMTPPATSSDDAIELTINKDENNNITFNSTLSPDVEYSLVMEGVNDYEVIAPATVYKSAEDNGTSYENRTITVKAKEKYDVSGGFMGLSGNAEVTALTFTNVEDDYVYNAAINADKDGYSIELRDGEYLAKATVADYSTKTHVVVNGGAVSKDLMFVSTAEKAKIAYVSDIYVGDPSKANNYATVNEAMEACELMTRDAAAPERITVHIAPGTYREQIMVKAPNVSFVNDSNDGEEVLLTWYYGIGYKYYSASGGNNSYYDAEKAYDKYEKNIAAKWGTAVYVQSTATGFRAEGITFENSFNRYVTKEEIEDGVEVAGNESITFVRNLTSDVTSKAATERATAISIEGANAEFKDCSFYSSQDTLYTAVNAYFKNCIIEGQTDYIFGSGNCVFDSCELSWKGYSIDSQGGYLTANRPGSDSELGYLFRNCTVTANSYNNLTVVAGDWGRPWGQNAKVIFMNTKLQSAGLITARGWTDMSGATAAKATGFKEYKTTAMDNTVVAITDSARVAHLMSDADAAAVNVKSYFGTWTPTYFTDDTESTVSIQGDLTLKDNGDINYLLPGHTLTVGYTLNSEANNANDASIVRWYTVKYTADGKPGEAKLVKTANGALDKTYKISKTDIGSYIKVTVTPGTVSGKTGTMKELTLYKTGDYDHVVNDGYYDPSTGSSSSLGDGVNIFLAGDSTTKDYSENGMYNKGTATNLGSWGEFLQCFFDESEVKIQNYANGGRSTRSFINDGSFDKIKDQISAGDYLFIQFAHNDSSAIASKKDVYVPLGEPDANGIYPYTAGTKVNGKYPDYAVSAGSTASDNGTATYKWFLKEYVDMALAAGATPVLLTPVARMYVDENTGNMKDHHIDEGSTTKEARGYCKAVKQVYDDYVAEGENVLFIDAYTITEKFYKDSWNETDKNTNNKQVMCIGDSTHSNKLGGLLTAAAYAQQLQNMNVTISAAVKAPSEVSALTVADVSNGITAGNAVFNIDANGNLTAYDLTKNCSAKAPYWEGIGNTMLSAIKDKAEELGSSTEAGAVATPTATLSKELDEDGNVESGTTVALGCTTDGAKIYYTTDGSNPKVSKTKEEYVDGTTTITITEDVTIKACAVKDGMTDSKIAVFNYTVAPLVKAPTAKTPSGTAVKSGAKIELETATTTEGVHIRYTMGANPADPTRYSTRYDAANGIIIKSDVTIKAIAVVGEDISEVSTFTYTIDTTASTEKPAKPTADTNSGSVDIGKVIRLTTTTEGAMIYYTKGANPAAPTTSNADLYDDAEGIVINSSAKIKAVAIKDGVSSDVADFEYNVPTTPTPLSTPEAGEIAEGASVTLKVTPEDGVTLSGVKIYYTTDRSNPKTSATRTEVEGDTVSITINADTTIKVYAVSTGLADSEVATYKYTLLAVPAPTASPDPAEPIGMGEEVTLSVPEVDGVTFTNVKIYYTKDGSNPKNSATRTEVEGKTTVIPIVDDTTIRAYAEAEGCKPSAAVRFEYHVLAAQAPTASPEAGQKVKKGTAVKLQSATENAEIWYTAKVGADETEVTKDDLDTKFTDDIIIREDTVIYAYAKAERHKDSEIKKFAYTVESESAPEISDKGIEIVGLKDEYDYTGAKITPDFSVVDNGIMEGGAPRVLSLGIDYTVKYANNAKENATATVTVIGKGNYSGKSVTGSFKIKSVTKVTEQNALSDLKGAKIATIAAQDYTGKPCYPNFKLTIKSESNKVVEYQYDVDTEQYVRADGAAMNVNITLSNNINKGTATLLVTGKKGSNSKVTSIKKTFKINAVDLSKAGNKLEVIVANRDPSVPYAVKGATPAVELSYTFSDDNKAELKAGRDYTVKYSANKKAGKAKFTITGKGNYTKKHTGTFTIDTLDMAETELVAVTVYDGLKAGKVKATVVDEKGDILKASQYTVEVLKAPSDTKVIDKNTKLNAGETIYVRAKAKDVKNLKTGTSTEAVEFKVGKNIAKAKFTLTATGKSKPYTGAAVELDVTKDLTVTIKEKGQKTPTTLKPKDDEGNGDYEIISYSNNINKGTATVVIRGINDYSGTKTLKFKITAKTMKKSAAPTS